MKPFCLGRIKSSHSARGIFLGSRLFPPARPGGRPGSGTVGLETDLRRHVDFASFAAGDIL